MLEARKGRWLMVYCVLQTLAGVDVQGEGGTRWREGVEYWLGVRLRGTPPWASVSGEGEGDEKGHWRSHCWRVARGGTGGAVVAGRVELEAAGAEEGVEEGEEGDDEGSPEPEERR